jgi:tetratricopeptide (TPR) repeat protein
VIHAEEQKVPMKLLSKILVCSLAISTLCVAAPGVAQEKAAPLARQIDADENRQITDIVRVTTATQKVQFLTAFLAAHPASVARPRLLTHVGISISREPDTAVRVDLAEKFLGLMSTDAERKVASAILADAYLKANRVDDAFQTIAILPNADSLDLRLLARLVSAGVEETRQRNLKHLMVSRKYGELAIRDIEADLRPVGMNAAGWSDYKGKALPSLYQSLGLLALQAGLPADAMTHLRKAVELAPDDPMNYNFLGAAANEEYSRASQQLKQMPAGPPRDALGQRTFELMNQVIDAYVHALALSSGTPLEQTIRGQVWADVESYYKFLHKGSLEGLQALIDKYKKQ